MALATIQDLQARLGVTYAAGAETTRAQAALDDATAFLQGELGQLIEAGTATVTFRHRGGVIRLPQQPVRAVTTVQINGVATTAFDFIDQELHLAARWGRSDFGDRTPYSDITVTFDYGYTVIPAELVAWTCVLASQLLAVSEGGTLGRPSVQMEQIDDYSVTYVTDGSNMSLPQPALDRLRARYGAGAHVTGVGRS